MKAHRPHVLPHIGSKKVKALALRDITKECGKNNAFSHNYVIVEWKVMRMADCRDDTIHLSDLTTTHQRAHLG